MRKRFITYVSVVFGFLPIFSVAQSGLGSGEIYVQQSDFNPTIKDAVKQTDVPEIIDTISKITNIQYGINSKIVQVPYTVIPIQHAKMVNEPLSKLYHMVLKAGYGNYNMPYGELFFNSLRSRDLAWGAHAKHLSSSRITFAKMGRADWSDNELGLFGRKYLKKHTLSGEFNYSRNVVHYYGFDTSLYKLKKEDITKITRQRFNTFELKTGMVSHYTDSTHINHTINLNYYNFGDYYNSFENNVFADGLINAYVSTEKLNVYANVDYYNNTLTADTFNNLLIRLQPYFSAEGKKWKADLGVTATIDKWSDINPKFYFYPRINVYYDIYEGIIVPYAGVTGGMKKNSFRSLANENPFILSDVLLKNTDNRYKVFGGLRGSLSSRTSYDVGVNYGKYNNMAFFLNDYNQRDNNTLQNKYKVVYMNAVLLNVNGQINYQYREKLRLGAKGNYYGYTIDSVNVQPWHKPNFDVTFSGLYNLKSKIIVSADVFVIGGQWAQTITTDASGTTKEKAILLNGVADINLGVEYRYSKMLSFFIKCNNLAGSRYYRWDKYPTQRFNGLIGLTFIPF